MAATSVKIFEYTDYRFFLKDYYAFRKKRDRHFTYRAFAMQAGVSASILKDVITGRRQLTISIMEKYAVAMGLSEKEIEYFRGLIGFVNAKNNQAKNEAFSAIMRVRRKKNLTFLDEKQYEFFSNWYFSAIRELITLPDFKEDYEWIARTITPSITAAQARKALEILLQLKLINREPSGKISLCDTVVSSPPEMNSLLLRNFHADMIKLALGALEQFVPAKREISSLTLGVSHACFETLKQKVRDFKEELLALVVEDNSPSQTVCQINFQLFPLVKDDRPVVQNGSKGIVK